MSANHKFLFISSRQKVKLRQVEVEALFQTSLYLIDVHL